MTNQINQEAEQPNPTVELIYEHIKEAPQQQMEIADKLDDKMLRIFGAASVVLGLLGLASTSSLGWRAVFFLLPVVPYALTAFWTFRHVNPNSFHWGMRADQLPTKWNEEEEQVRRALINDIGQSYSKNKPILEHKAWYIRASLVTTAIEVALVVIALILYRLF